MKLRFSVARASAVLATAALCSVALAQQAGPAEPRNVLQLSATGSVDVAQDMLTLTMNTSREGNDANAVQAQLKSALDAAVSEAKKTAQPGQMDVRTGSFSLYPRHNRDGKISGWQGSAELVLEGRDFARITAASSRIDSLTIGNIGFGLSREAREKAESQAQAQAIERFKARAAEIARSFGFADYSLREVSVSGGGGEVAPMMYGRAKAMMADAAGAPVAVEPGQSTVTVTVSGAVQAR